MLIDLGLGTVVISATVLIHTVGLIALARLIGAGNRWFGRHRNVLGRTMSMIATVLGLFVVHGFEIWRWAFVYVGVGAFDAIDSASIFPLPRLPQWATAMSCFRPIGGSWALSKE